MAADSDDILALGASGRLPRGPHQSFDVPYCINLHYLFYGCLLI
jgi:hypothetical protein